ncbi:MAG: hypothetical protein N4A72_06920 [Bacteroidales bacterium]|jgi:bacteriocin-like protein|nr:hypothetical protein [Bacteroidales bacterium]
MINNILNVDGVKELSKDELKKTNGGKINCVEIPGTMDVKLGPGDVPVAVVCTWHCTETKLFGLIKNEFDRLGGCSL